MMSQAILLPLNICFMASSENQLSKAVLMSTPSYATTIFWPNKKFSRVDANYLPPVLEL